MMTIMRSLWPALVLFVAACGGRATSVLLPSSPSDEAGSDAGEAGVPVVDAERDDFAPTTDGGTDSTSGDAAADSTSGDTEVDDSPIDDGPALDGTPEASCAVGATECSGQQPQVCGPSGQWENAGSPCADQWCIDGACVGVCGPGQGRCESNAEVLCDAGQWEAFDCSNQTCLVGGCTGVCGPEGSQCADGGVATCNSDGTWGTAIPCGCGGSCTYGLCAGCCTPGSTQCLGNGLQMCGVNADWGATIVPCPSATLCTSGLCDSTTAPSCAATGPGLTDCGASSESCCTSIEVPGGTYQRTFTQENGPEGDDVTVSGFRLDKYDVTVGRFRQFVSAVLPTEGGAGWLPASGSGKHVHLNGGQGLVAVGYPLDGGVAADAGTVYESGWASAYDSNVVPTDANLACESFATWTTAASDSEHLPIDCVNWYEAYAFCIWDGGFLPSEAEWELAGTGGDNTARSPGERPTPTRSTTTRSSTACTQPTRAIFA